MRFQQFMISPSKVVGIAVCLAVVQPLQAQDLDWDDGSDAAHALEDAGPVTTLRAALERAYATNPGLEAERARLESVDFRLPQSRARSGPQLNFEASYGFRRETIGQPTVQDTTRSGWAPSASAVFSQPLFTFGRNASSERGVSAQIDYQRALVRATTQQVLLQTVSAYVAVRRDREAVRIAQENLALLERDLSDNLTRLSARDTTRTDVQQVATRVELGRAQLLQAQRLAAMAEADFLEIVGSPAGELAPPPPFAVRASSLGDAYALAQRSNPVVAAAYARERISRAQISSARAERRPRIDLRSRAGIDTNLIGLERQQQTALRGEVVLSGPIFQSGALGARINEAEAANYADWRLIDQTLRDIRSEVSDAWNELATANASVENLTRAVELAEQAYGGAVQQQRNGMRTTLDVLDLARDLLSAKVTLNQSLATAQVAQVKLMSAIGVLDGATDLDLRGYDADEHYERVRNDGDLPLITSGLQALDSIILGSQENREGRDPSSSLLPPEVSPPGWGPALGALPERAGLSRAPGALDDSAASHIPNP